MAGGPDIVSFYSNFYNVLLEIFPDLEHLHYGIDERPPRGLVWTRLRRLLDGGRRTLERVCREADLARLPPRTAALDVGCGVGGTALHLARHFDLDVTGVNVNAAQLGVATARTAAAGLAGQVRFVAGDGTALPFADRSFELAVMIEVAFHVADKERLFTEVARVLRPGGTFVLLDQENAAALEVMQLFFFPAYGTHRRLAAAAGLERVREVDLSAELANWMEDYLRTAERPFTTFARWLAWWRGGSALVRRYDEGMRYYDTLVRNEIEAKRLEIDGPFKSGAHLLRRTTLRCMRDGRARYQLLVCRRGDGPR
jgi:ubiquinone/menaquinone biosynthesis C-methylase UbiE